jgi:hypothetical protein
MIGGGSDELRPRALAKARSFGDRISSSSSSFMGCIDLMSITDGTETT